MDRDRHNSSSGDARPRDGEVTPEILDGLADLESDLEDASELAADNGLTALAAMLQNMAETVYRAREDLVAHGERTGGPTGE